MSSEKKVGFEKILNENIKLKILQMEDAEDFYNIINDNKESLLKWVPDLEQASNLQNVKNFILFSEMSFEKSKTNLKVGIWYNSKLCGCIGINRDFQKDSEELGYWLIPEYQQKGIMYNSLKSMILEIPEGNIASISLARKLGFVKEGTLRRHVYFNEKFHDLCIYGLLKEEFE
eukprot:gene8652-599_t